jgi:hypothetical protein
MKKNESGRQADGQAWLHRQNIARYRALLANAARHDDHDQVRRLLAEEEEKLRALGAS